MLKAFFEHDASTAAYHGWTNTQNGMLLAKAEKEHFQLLLTTDSNIYHQQNLTGLHLAILCLHPADWRVLKDKADQIVAHAVTMKPGQYDRLSFARHKKNRSM